MQLGLIGKSLTHSFSKRYFEDKFDNLQLKGFNYSNFELASIEGFPQLIASEPKLNGLNVTIPYKQSIIPYLAHISEEAKSIGAVNTIKIKNGQLLGYNTDAYGFIKSLEPLLASHHTKALLLGSGGASKAVAYSLSRLGIEHLTVSRTPNENDIDYAQASRLLGDYALIINCTPLGTFPNVNEMPPLDIESLNEKSLVYDLIYNPNETLLLTRASQKGARIKNGYEMLVLQAEKAWSIWNEL